MKKRQRLLDILEDYLNPEMKRFRHAYHYLKLNYADQSESNPSKISIFSLDKMDNTESELILEACLLHSRLLLDFFFLPYKMYKDGIYIFHYFPDKEELSVEFNKLLNKPNWVDSYRAKLNQQVAHMTCSTKKNQAWSDLQFSHIDRLIYEFMKALESSTKFSNTKIEHTWK